MLIARTLPELRAGCAVLRRNAPTLALVPTMGALHAGHLALVAAARQRAAAVVASIFVNPLQFGPAEDLARYPCDETADLAALRQAGCDLVWLPDAGTMYPPGSATRIVVGGPARRWEGAARPGHFEGVATVVTKLFGQVRPEIACFGEKDWQQVQVVRRMAADLDLGVAIEVVPTVRDADGLALSSRNRFLLPEQRVAAARLPAALRMAVRDLADGRPAQPVLSACVATLRAHGFQPDYLALVDAESLEPLEAARPPARLIAAARLGPVRLLDTMVVA